MHSVKLRHGRSQSQSHSHFRVRSLSWVRSQHRQHEAADQAWLLADAKPIWLTSPRSFASPSATWFAGSRCADSFLVRKGHAVYDCQPYTCCMRCGYIRSCISCSDQCSSVSNLVGSCSMYPLTADCLRFCFSWSSISAIFSNLQEAVRGLKQHEEHASAARACLKCIARCTNGCVAQLPLRNGRVVNLWQQRKDKQQRRDHVLV